MGRLKERWLLENDLLQKINGSVRLGDRNGQRAEKHLWVGGKYLNTSKGSISTSSLWMVQQAEAAPSGSSHFVFLKEVHEKIPQRGQPDLGYSLKILEVPNRQLHKSLSHITDLCSHITET